MGSVYSHAIPSFQILTCVFLNTYTLIPVCYSTSSAYFASLTFIIGLPSTLSSNSCTYTPCSVCARINMYDEIFIHIHPKIDIYPFRSRLSSKHRLCAQLCIYVLDLARTHIPTSNYLFSHQALFALHTHYS